MKNTSSNPVESIVNGVKGVNEPLKDFQNSIFTER